MWPRVSQETWDCQDCHIKKMLRITGHHGSPFPFLQLLMAIEAQHMGEELPNQLHGRIPRLQPWRAFYPNGHGHSWYKLIQVDIPIVKMVRCSIVMNGWLLRLPVRSSGSPTALSAAQCGVAPWDANVVKGKSMKITGRYKKKWFFNVVYLVFYNALWFSMNFFLESLITGRNQWKSMNFS